MEQIVLPRIISEKRTTPTVYLDSCAIIELARYKKGICTDAHKKEVGELFNVLSSLMQNNQVYCPCGNQLSEVGMTTKRKDARTFLFQFTNADFLPPESIFSKQLKAGYQAYKKEDKSIILGVDSVYKEDHSYQSPFKIHVAPVYAEEKASALCSEKKHIADVLNKMKSQGQIRERFEDQLTAELEAEYISFLANVLDNSMDSEGSFMRYLEEIKRFHRITGTLPDCDAEQYTQALISYCLFLTSPYHDFLPYIWIRANLWTHLMQRPNKIKKSDNLDIQWASAYLPIIDYAVTDNDFCNTLQKTGLAEMYKVKVYSLNTLQQLIDDLTIK